MNEHVPDDNSKSAGSPAEERLAADTYAELHRLAVGQFRGQAAGHTLQPTALVHEAYVKLAHHLDVIDGDRTQFLMIAAKAMRQVLIDHARAKGTEKRGKDWERVTIAEASDSDGTDIDVLALDEALTELERLDAGRARLVELRFFGGLTEAEAAAALGISRSDATRQWRLIRAWLSHRLRAE